MNLLTEGIRSHIVSKTVLTRKLTLDGITRAYPVYSIKLDVLYYNDQNDRIATWISYYKSEHEGHMPDLTDREAYNAVIEDFIVQSNPEAIKKTRQNIELVGQREPGVVLADGRIIDGNRRFTCLRQLAEKDGRFGTIEAVILDKTLETGLKQIKMLELSIQHGEETKVEYNPVDRLVGVYNDIIETGLFTPAEYAYYTNETEAEVRRRMESAKLMIEFLEFIHAPKQYHIARDLQVVFPLEEAVKLLKKCNSPEEAQDIKQAAFTNILMQTTGEMGRFIRGMKAVIGTEHQKEFIAEQKAITEKVVSSLPVETEVTREVIRDKIRADRDNAAALEQSMDKALNKVKKDTVRNQPILLTEKAAAALESVDTNILQKMTENELGELKKQLEAVEKALREIKEKFGFVGIKHEI